MVTEKKIGVLAGGVSAEREVSLRSGAAILNALQERGHNAVFIDAGPDLCRRLSEEAVEAAFLALHGGHGENGAVQGLLEVMGIPYTGSGVLASALAMDKVASKTLFRAHGIPVAPFVVLHAKDRPHLSPGEIGEMAGFSLPWVVKPSTEGSSIGVCIVKDPSALGTALDEAFAYGTTVLVEKYIKGKEIQIGVLGDTALGGVEVRPSLEFYSYEAKYTAGLTRYVLPPELDDTDYELLRQAAVKAHAALGCAGASRVDFILDEAHTPYVLEVNTIPGMTETSLLPKIAGLAGLSFGDLVEEILRRALSA